MNILKLQNVYFNYRKNTTPFSLKDISIQVNKGDFLSIIGANGSGKSTLLKLIANIYYPSSGEILFRDNKYSEFQSEELAKNISYVPQNINTFFQFSVYEIVMMGRSPYMNWIGYETSEDHRKVIEAMQIVEIEHLKNRGINEISGGEAQRAFIARAIVQEPEIMLLDEPSSHLDLIHQVSIYNLLKKLNSEKEMTVIIVSHDLNLSGYYSDRTILIDNGSIILDDKTKNVLTTENIRKYFRVESEVKFNCENENLSVLIKPDYF